MSYNVRFSTSASASVRQLDKPSMQRVLNRINWLAENFEQIKPVQLTGTFAGLYKFRIGDYRLIYSVDHENKIISALYFSHRKNAYRKH